MNPKKIKEEFMNLFMEEVRKATLRSRLIDFLIEQIAGGMYDDFEKLSFFKKEDKKVFLEYIKRKWGIKQ